MEGTVESHHFQSLASLAKTLPDEVLINVESWKFKKSSKTCRFVDVLQDQKRLFSVSSVKTEQFSGYTDPGAHCC